MPKPEPKSDDPKFWEHWTNNYEDNEFQFDNGEPDFENVCRTWEGGTNKLSKDSVYAKTQTGAKAKKSSDKPKDAD